MASKAAPELRSGLRLGKWVLIEKLGSGAFSEVWSGALGILVPRVIGALPHAVQPVASPNLCHPANTWSRPPSPIHKQMDEEPFRQSESVVIGARAVRRYDPMARSSCTRSTQ